MNTNILLPVRCGNAVQEYEKKLQANFSYTDFNNNYTMLDGYNLMLTLACG